jgi:hypothetical protein
MATRKKKKTESVVYPKITQGTHLIVIEEEDGTTELIWDDEALAREVREAIASVENKNRKGK